MKRVIPKHAHPKQGKGEVTRVKPQALKAHDARQAMFRYNQFISHYLRTGGNARKSAILAGYAPATAHIDGSRLLKHAYIRERINDAQARMLANTEVSIESTVRELVKVKNANMGDYVRINEFGDPEIDLSGLDPDQWAAIAEVNTEIELRPGSFPIKKVKIKLHDKLGAADKILRHLGGYNRDKSGNPDSNPENHTTVYTLNIGNANILVKPHTNEPLPQP